MRTDQTAFEQMGDGGLDRSLGDACQFREHAVAHCNRVPAGAVGETVELEIDKERRGGAAVRDQVPHEGVDEVGVDSHFCSNRYYSSGCRHCTPRILLRAAEAGILRV